MPALAVAARPSEERTGDHALVAAVRAGDDRAFEGLYERYHRRICAYVLGMVHDHGRAEDITQDVFMSALRRMRENDRDIVFKPWIYEIAKNACIDAFRRSRRAQEVSFDAQDGVVAGEMGRLADAPVTPDVAIDTKQQIDHLCGAFGGLSDAHHEILVMREFEGLSYREIGERLGMTRPSVESTLFRARRRLGEEYEELVTGQRCVRVQEIIATAGDRSVGARDRRRLTRHISHCQPCRRHARLAGVELEAPAAQTGSAAARIAALLPMPAFLRRRWFGGDEGGGALAAHSPASANVAQWSANVVGTLDPAAVAGWSKAVVAAATVAVAGVGAGAAIGEREAVRDLISRTPIISELDPAGGAPS
ncbi:MAG: sigma-70 family RNA polymerase sigma factor, partial [Solirubrobacterales bacterium]|nr:sigma-70 family RNA polymerase sigma factor [Solirubrobacterales bacterium]